MRDAYVIGAAQTDFGTFPKEGYRSMFERAFDATCESVEGDIGVDDVDEAFIGMIGIGGRQIGLSGAGVTEHVGLHGVPSMRVENACAASGYAVRQAVQAVRSGMADVVLAGGVEMMNDLSADTAKYWFGVSGEMEWERMAGTTFSGVYAQIASAHMAEYGTTREQLSRVAVKNHSNGAKNPHAHLQSECTLEEAEDAPTVAAPLNLYHCCPMSDGAAGVLVANEDVVDQYADTRVRVAGVGAASGSIGLFQRSSYTSLPASRKAGSRAFEAAGVSPKEIDFAEIHDCFAIAELMAYEDLGFCDPGESGRLLEEGVTSLDGRLPVNTSGGLKAKGHPIGATGAAQVAEAYSQLTHSAAERQVSNARYGLTHNVGGSGGAAVVHVFERETEGAA
jgi:acetyl-CoA C-acetyltransferase